MRTVHSRPSAAQRRKIGLNGCREGTGWLYRMLTRIVDGKGRPEDIEQLEEVSHKIEGRTICALGDAAAMPVWSFIKHFRHEFEYYVEHKRSIIDNAA